MPIERLDLPRRNVKQDEEVRLFRSLHASDMVHSHPQIQVLTSFSLLKVCIPEDSRPSMTL